MEQDSKDNVFEIRRTLRFSFVSLWMYWEHWLNSLIDYLVTDRIWSMIDPSKAGSIDEKTVAASVRADRIGRLDFETKIDLVVLLTGIDIRKNKNLQKFLELREHRNRILHQGQWKWSVTPGEFIERLDEGIRTTRGFFEFWARNRGVKPDEYLYYEEPVDMRSLGYGYLPSR